MSSPVIKGCLAGLAAASLFAGCGSESDQAGQTGRQAAKPAFGADTPENAVKSFLAAAGHPKDSYTNLTEACRQLAPSIRAAIRFSASLTPDERDCAAGLSVLLFYTGDDSGVAAPSGFTGRVVTAAARADQAVVTVAMRYEGSSSPGETETRVLVVKERGSWWVATPTTLNVMAARKPLTDQALGAQYRDLTAAAQRADRRDATGQRATTAIEDDVHECPRGGASSADDARGDVRLADGMGLAEQQVEAHDLTEVVHNGDGDQACFELHFAADAPESGTVQLAVNPGFKRVAVTWTASTAVGQGGSADAPEAVAVNASRSGSTIALRLPKAALGIAGGPYRWAAEVLSPTQEARVTHVDSVPDDLTITGEQDHYIPHAG